MSDLSEKIAELVIENDRIKKTSKMRFNQVKKSKSESRQLARLTSRFNCLKDFLIKHDLPIKYHSGLERIDFSLFNALRGLIAKDKRIDRVSVDGIYAVKVDGEYKIAKIVHRLCWKISYIDNDDEFIGLHFINPTDFVLLEML